MSTLSPRIEKLCRAQQGPTPTSKWLFWNEKQMLFFLSISVLLFETATNFPGHEHL